MEAKARNRKTLAWQIEKHYRWFRRDRCHAYLKRVKAVEREIGGEIHAC